MPGDTHLPGTAMDTPDITTQVLIQIRDRLDQLVAEAVETNHRIDDTNHRIDRTNRQLANLDARLSTEIGGLRDEVRELRGEVRDVKDEVRDVKGEVRDLKDVVLGREPEAGLRDRVTQCERDIAELRQRG